MKDKVLDATRDLMRIGAVVAVVTVVTVLLGVHVWNQYRITRLGYEISEVTTEHRRLMEENKKLSIEVAVQGRTERMTAVARERFGLQPLGPDQVRRLSATTLETPENLLSNTRHASLEAF